MTKASDIKIIKNTSQIVTLSGVVKKDGRRLAPGDLGIIEKGSIVFDSEQILWIGKEKDLPQEYCRYGRVINLEGRIVLPEMVDPHTHVVFAGDRSKEYSLRLNGDDYVEIARRGGGILYTMKQTNGVSKVDLKKLALERIERIYSYGLGTIEIKSGYGLNIHREEEISRLIDEIKKELSPRIKIVNTYMAAHAVPPSYKNSHSYVVEAVIPLMKKLAQEEIIDAVDVFHEEGYFNSDDVKILFEEATKSNIPVKIHADEFCDNGGAGLACKFQALSADHLLKTGKEGIEALAASSTIATLLPGTGFFLGKDQADGRKMLDAGAKVALGSDYNPGSCHCDNLLFLASIAAPQYGLNICELWAAITYNSAHALGLKNQGALELGMHPRFSLFDTDSIDKVTYHWGKNFAFRDKSLQ